MAENKIVLTDEQIKGLYPSRWEVLRYWLAGLTDEDAEAEVEVQRVMEKMDELIPWEDAKRLR